MDTRIKKIVRRLVLLTATYFSMWNKRFDTLRLLRNGAPSFWLFLATHRHLDALVFLGHDLKNLCSSFFLFYFPPFIFWQKVMNSAQQAWRVLRGWVSVSPVLECIRRLCLMHVDPLWLTPIVSASTPAAVRTAVMDSSWTRMSSMEVRDALTH